MRQHAQGQQRACLSEEPGLAALGVQMGVAAEEGVEGGQLVPARLQLRIHVPKEAPHVRPCSHMSTCSDDRCRIPAASALPKRIAQASHHSGLNRMHPEALLPIT